MVNKQPLRIYPENVHQPWPLALKYSQVRRCAGTQPARTTFYRVLWYPSRGREAPLSIYGPMGAKRPALCPYGCEAPLSMPLLARSAPLSPLLARSVVYQSM